MSEDKGPLAVLEDTPDLGGLAFAHRDVEQQGALCAKVDTAEELGAFVGEPLSISRGSQQESSGPGDWRGM